MGPTCPAAAPAAPKWVLLAQQLPPPRHLLHVVQPFVQTLDGPHVGDVQRAGVATSHHARAASSSDSAAAAHHVAQHVATRVEDQLAPVREHGLGAGRGGSGSVRVVGGVRV